MSRLVRIGFLLPVSSACSSPQVDSTVPLVDLLSNVAEEHPEKVKELSELLESWRLWVAKHALPTDEALTEGMSGEELERLRSLGYVQ